MIHDQNLLDRLSEMPTTGFGGEVFRATRPDADPTAPAIQRWQMGAAARCRCRCLCTIHQSGARRGDSRSCFLSRRFHAHSRTAADQGVTAGGDDRPDIAAGLGKPGSTRRRSRALWRTGLCSDSENRRRPRISGSRRADCAICSLALRESDDFHRESRSD
jgi:hypothetical protein